MSTHRKCLVVPEGGPGICCDPPFTGNCQNSTREDCNGAFFSDYDSCAFNPCHNDELCPSAQEFEDMCSGIPSLRVTWEGFCMNVPSSACPCIAPCENVTVEVGPICAEFEFSISHYQIRTSGLRPFALRYTLPTCEPIRQSIGNGTTFGVVVGCLRTLIPNTGGQSRKSMVCAIELNVSQRPNDARWTPRVIAQYYRPWSESLDCNGITGSYELFPISFAWLRLADSDCISDCDVMDYTSFGACHVERA